MDAMEFVRTLKKIVVVENNCGCVLPHPEETPISSRINFSGVYIDVPDVNIDDIKFKVILEVQNVISQLECGILPDLEFILEEISLVEINE